MPVRRGGGSVPKRGSSGSTAEGASKAPSKSQAGGGSKPGAKPKGKSKPKSTNKPKAKGKPQTRSKPKAGRRSAARAAQETSANLGRAFEEIELALDERHYEVLRRRRLTIDRPETLAVIGDDMGVTRERVRQIEAAAVEVLDEMLERRLGHPLVQAAVTTRSRLGKAVLMEDLEGAVDAVDPAGTAIGDRADRLGLLLYLAGPYARDGEWILCDLTLETTSRALDAATEEGPFPVEQALAVIGAFGVAERNREQWLAAHPRHKVLEDKVHRWPRTMAGRVVTLLEMAGHPLELREIARQLGYDETKRNLSFTLGKDDRLRRVGKSSFGLVRWNLPEYTNITDLIVREVSSRGGAVQCDELVAHLTAVFDISPNSVHSYLAAPLFSVTEGVVRLRPDRQHANGQTPIELTKRCFRHQKGWAIRAEVTTEVFRGSGQRMPIAFAREVGLQPGGDFSLDTKLGPIRCSWPTLNPYLGSIKPIVEKLDAELGDVFFLTAPDEGGVATVKLIRSSELEAARGVDRLVLECGRPRRGKPIGQVARALDIKPSAADAVDQIRKRLHRRKEHDLIALLPDG